jgi:hypothetical protein
MIDGCVRIVENGYQTIREKRNRTTKIRGRGTRSFAALGYVNFKLAEDTMYISDLIKELSKVKAKNGDLEVMTTHFDGVEAFQTTVENLIVEDYEFLRGGKEKVVKLTL